MPFRPSIPGIRTEKSRQSHKDARLTKNR